MCLRQKEGVASPLETTALEERPLVIEGNTAFICWDGLLTCGKWSKGDLQVGGQGFPVGLAEKEGWTLHPEQLTEFGVRALWTPLPHSWGVEQGENQALALSLVGLIPLLVTIGCLHPSLV